MKIKTYHFEKVIDKEVDVFIPEKHFYCFQTGIRRSIRIVPIFNRDLVIYKLEVTCIYLSFECIIEKFNISICDIEGIMNRTENSKETSIIKMLLDNDYYERTEEQFTFDLAEAINKISNIE